MTRIGTIIGALAFVLLPLSTVAADEHVMAAPDSLKWGPGPAALPKSEEMAVIAGDPGKEGPYVYRIRVPAGYKVQPHTHPADENVTVISGTFNIAMGDKFDESKGTALKAGGFFQGSGGNGALRLVHRADRHPVPWRRADRLHLCQSGRRPAQEQLIDR